MRAEIARRLVQRLAEEARVQVEQDPVPHLRLVLDEDVLGEWKLSRWAAEAGLHVEDLVRRVTSAIPGLAYRPRSGRVETPDDLGPGKASWRVDSRRGTLPEAARAGRWDGAGTCARCGVLVVRAGDGEGYYDALQWCLEERVSPAGLEVCATGAEDESGRWLCDGCARDEEDER